MTAAPGSRRSGPRWHLREATAALHAEADRLCGAHDLSTLPGYARRIHDFWHEDLREGGFGFQARIINFSRSGIPGDVGLFITWSEAKAEG